MSNEELAKRLRDAIADVRPGAALRADLVTKLLADVMEVVVELESPQI